MNKATRQRGRTFDVHLAIDLSLPCPSRHEERTRHDFTKIYLDYTAKIESTTGAPPGFSKIVWEGQMSPVERHESISPLSRRELEAKKKSISNPMLWN